MNRIILLFSFAVLVSITGGAHAQGILDRVKQKAKDKVNQRADEKLDKAMDKTLDDAENKTKGNGDNTENRSAANAKSNTLASTGSSNIKAYQNYDFVPGDKILFEDHFSDDRDAEFPAHWQLEKGQGQLNKIQSEESFFLTEGNYVVVKPRMKTDKYLTDPFTVEFDYLNKDHAYSTLLFLRKPNSNEVDNYVGIGESEVSYTIDADQTSKRYPGEFGEDNFINKWHHIAIAVNNHQIKVYVDQNRVLVVPDTKADFSGLAFGGVASEEKPLIFKNVRIASGGGMNLIGKKFTESKIVTHGINFDVDKATMRPESMGTLNMIVQVLKENPDVKFEIDGHSDNTGNSSHNLTLSQQRAEAVKAQLVAMGISQSRLTVKGFGDSKPLNENTTPEGRANNRRVEFVRM